MKIENNPVSAFFFGDPQADKIVPNIGLTSWLVVFTSAAMAFLAVFALIGMAAGPFSVQARADQNYRTLLEAP